MKSLTWKAIFLLPFAALSLCAMEKATFNGVTLWTAPSAIAQEKRSTEEKNDSGTAPEGSNKTEGESSPQKASPLKDFVPSESIEPDKAVDFPADI